MKLVFLSLLIVTFALSVAGQKDQKSELRGQVSDRFGAVIPGVKITAADADKKEYSTYSDREGSYRLKLSAGVYRLQFSRRPMEDFVIADYLVIDSGDMTLDVALRCNNCEVWSDAASARRSENKKP